MMGKIKAIPAVAFLNWRGDEWNAATLDWYHKMGHHSHELVRRMDVEKVVTIGVESQQASAGDARSGAMAEREAAIAYFEKLSRETEDQSALGKSWWAKQAAIALRECWHLPTGSEPAAPQPNFVSESDPVG